MLSEGSPNVNRPACGKKFQKINKQFLYHRDPMWTRKMQPSNWVHFLTPYTIAPFAEDTSPHPTPDCKSISEKNRS